MRIGFDARMIDHPGIGRYISCLLPEVIKQSPGDEFILFGLPEKLGHLGEKGNARIVRWTPAVYSLQEQVFFPYDRYRLDLVHVPHFNIPVLSKAKLVVTIHDLIYLLFPGSVPSPLAGHYARFMINSALRKAGRVITVSKNTKRDLTGMFGEEYSDKIEVIHEAAGNDFKRVKDKTRLADVRCRYRLSEKVILYVGSVKPHKNVGALIEVFGLLKKWGLPHQLVICGRWDRKEDRLKEGMVGRDIKYLGEVPTDDLIALYSMADVLVHLSLYEGFGLTVLEAMQCGTPVVVSDSSSLPEVAGRSAFLVSPSDIEQTADIVYNIIVNKELKSGMVESGLENVKQFSWRETARQTLKVYHRLT
ncbi:MAG: glycosyltransferase family 1 protein [Candidatus Omnitrophota bacterium]|nr:glycosyltransferase family 1 protein [Candidatus Omnitrophota bacterium]